MKWSLIIVALMASGCAAQQPISESAAIKLAERGLAQDYGKKAVDLARPFQAVLRKDEWTVMGHDSPESLSGPLVATVNARTGAVEVQPILMTDPDKFKRLSKHAR